jgi:hypothetical protein
MKAHRNPLRAKMVTRLADYRWSSYRVYSYGRKHPDWLKTDLIFSFFEGKQKEQIERYRKKVQFYSVGCTQTRKSETCFMSLILR